MGDYFDLEDLYQPNCSKKAVSDPGSPAIMIERALEYLEKMRIRNTQYLVVQHTDREHPHIHIVYNRVSNEGSWCRSTNKIIEATLEAGLPEPPI